MSRRRTRFGVAAFAAALTLSLPLASATDEQAIKAVVTSAYVEGILINRDPDAVRAGFHHEFLMHVLDDGKVIKAPLEMWLERLELDGVPNEKTVHCEFLSIDVTGDTGAATLEVYEDGQHFYTDYVGLYRVDGLWKIVNKVFQSH